NSIFPSQVALARDNVFEWNLGNRPVPHDYHRFLFNNSFHHSDPSPEKCHAVALLERSLLLLLEIVLLPQVDDVIQSIRVVALAVFPKSPAFSVVKHEDVGAERS